MRTYSCPFIVAAVGAVLFAGDAYAGPIALTPAAPGYAQDFDTLANTGTGVSFTNDSTIPGLWAGQTAGATTTTYVAASTYTPSDGSDGNVIGFQSLGTASATDRAFGTRNAGAVGTARFGLLFQNATTDQTITSLAIGLNGEQWRQDISKTAGTSNSDKLVFSYRVFATGPTGAASDVDLVLAGTATGTATQLDFDSPKPQLPNASGGATALDGNVAANRTALSYTLTGLSIAPNRYVVIRWQDSDIAGNDNSLGIDDLNVSATFTPTPEPASLGALAVGGLVLLRRRRAV